MGTDRVALVGGEVWTAGFAQPRELDVLISGGRVASVARAGDLVLDKARVEDISGRVLIPGFQDAHVHPLLAGMNLLACNLMEAQSADEALAAIAAHANGLPAAVWIVGGGWRREMFPAGGPTRRQLDTVTGGRPALLRTDDCHGAWANSAALALAGVDRTTPDPPQGWFVREADGTPAGMVEERAVELVHAVMPEQTMEFRRQALLTANRRLVELGITSVQDAIVGGGFGIPDQIPAYRDLLSNRTWRGRLTAALWWDPERGVEQIPDLLAARAELEEAAGPDLLLADTVKLMVDGANTVFLDRAATREATMALDALGLTCHFHSYGELSTQWILDSVAEARTAHGTGGGRHHIAHLMVVAETDFPRFAALDVTANLQAYWGASAVQHDILRLTSCSHDSHLREYAFGRLATAGARLAAGSDWPVSTPDPLAAVREEARRGRDRTASVATGAPDELDRLDVLGLLTAYTAGSAHVNGRASTTGRIAPGFMADLAVLDRDPFAAEGLRDVAVEQTWIGGVIEYDRRTR
ncbi:amidohydrolase [Spirillospora sp. NPDC050679]